MRSDLKPQNCTFLELLLLLIKIVQYFITQGGIVYTAMYLPPTMLLPLKVSHNKHS